MSASYPTNGSSERSAADGSSSSLGSLRRFTQKREPSRSPLEHCDLCNDAIGSVHRHLLDLANRAIVCTCDPCAILFNNQGAGVGKYALVPRRYDALPDFQMSDEQWDELMIPVNMAFIYPSIGEKRVQAYYPGPAGATESLLDLDGWDMLVSGNPILKDLEPDVEALLINRVREAREYFIVPIDACYQLVGLIRLSWKGLSGGEAAWEAIAEFFADLRKKC